MVTWVTYHVMACMRLSQARRKNKSLLETALGFLEFSRVLFQLQLLYYSLEKYMSSTVMNCSDLVKYKDLDWKKPLSRTVHPCNLHDWWSTALVNCWPNLVGKWCFVHVYCFDCLIVASMAVSMWCFSIIFALWTDTPFSGCAKSLLQKYLSGFGEICLKFEWKVEHGIKVFWLFLPDTHTLLLNIAALQGYVHSLTEVLTSSKRNTNYLRFNLQTDNSETVQLVCYSPKKRKPFKSPMTRKAL